MTTCPGARPREGVRAPDVWNRGLDGYATSSSRDDVVASRHDLSDRAEKTSQQQGERRDLSSRNLQKAILAWNDKKAMIDQQKRIQFGFMRHQPREF